MDDPARQHGRHSRGRRGGSFLGALGAAIAIVVAASLAAAPSASALITVSESHTFPCIPLPGPGDCKGGLSTTLTPDCPRGTQVVAGGFLFDAWQYPSSPAAR